MVHVKVLVKKHRRIFLSIWGAVVTSVLAVAALIGGSVIDYYCSPNSVFLWMDLSNNPYCGALVIISHIVGIGLVISIGAYFVLSVLDKSRKFDVSKYVYPKNRRRRVGINIYNSDISDLEDVRIKLVEMKKIEMDHRTNRREIMPITFDEDNRLFDLGGKSKVEAGDNEPFVLAEIQEMDVVFLLHKKPYLCNPSKYSYPIVQSDYSMYQVAWDVVFDVYGKVLDNRVKKRFSTQIKSTRIEPIDDSLKKDDRHDTVTIDIGEIIRLQ